MNKIKASKVLFIKLGTGGEFEKDCIEQSNTLKLSYKDVNHEDCMNKDWEAIHKYFTDRGDKLGTATSHKNQIQQFYEADETTLWITFYGRKLWWCFSKPEISLESDNRKTRPVIGKWSDKDINGNVLFESSINGQLLKTQGYRGTICSVSEQKYALNKINCEEKTEIIEVAKAIENLKEKLKPVIQSLQWKDFETLIDLVFRQAGWQRISDTGKTQKTIDLELLSPVTGERAAVQIKSQSTLKEFEDYKERFEAMTDCDKFFFIAHSADNSLTNYKNDTDIKIYLIDKVAELVIAAGLIDWLIKKAS